ncbi:AraC family transcriptional regulator [Paenibacillus sp. 32O-W]|uniref:HTH-type transcriptional regulator YfiF n=1 Tax=Paenibacillus cisolokensis TaxID=1658519 RepID=A0ABQ4NB10_9BACL|nr:MULTISPECIES: AraC family transcriptional regulator [Paenibacillus]ALS29235.1 AraC family transcriptional regulator [Paenibacillus sp. 32O-W]GIQ65413.1 putative HTH-type transcriptional regulator YfiF [Paenibacillus cisolokensis]
MDQTLCERAVAVLRRLTAMRGMDGEYAIHYWGGSPNHPDNPYHRHSFMECCYVVSGSGEYRDGEESHRIGPGDLFASRPGVYHQIHRGEKLFLLWVAFEPAAGISAERERRWREWAGSASYLLRSAGTGHPAGAAWRGLYGAAAEGMSAETLQAWADALISSMCDAFTAHRPLSPMRAGPEQLLERAKRFVADNLDQPLQLQMTARTLHISARHCSRLFAKYEGMSYTQYVNQQRIETAKALLRSGSVSIKEVAERTGFGSVHYFTRMFAARTGMTPGAYRDLPSDLPVGRQE